MLDSFATLWTVACQAPLSMGFSRQEYWSELLFPFPGHLPDPGIKPVLAGRFFFFFFFTTKPLWKPTWVIVQSPSHVQFFVTPWTSTPGLSVPHHLLKFSQVHIHCIGDAIQPSHLLIPSSPSAQSFPASGTFQWVRCSLRWSKYWSFSIIPSNEYSELISLKLDCFDLLTVQGTSGVFSRTIVWRDQFFSVLPSLQSSSKGLWDLTLCQNRQS